jgi:hypothetical protein
MLKKILPILVAVQVMILTAIAVLTLQNEQMQNWNLNAYQEKDPKNFYIYNKNIKQSDLEFSNILNQISMDNNCAIVRIDDIPTDTIVQKFDIGVIDPNHQLEFPELGKGTHKSGITTINSPVTWTTYTNNQKTNHQIFNLLDNSTITIESILNLAKSSQTINGTYGVFSDNPTTYTKVVQELSQKIGVSQQELSTQVSGRSIGDNFYVEILITLFLIIFVGTIFASVTVPSEYVAEVSASKLLGFSNLMVAAKTLKNTFWGWFLGLSFSMVITAIVFWQETNIEVFVTISKYSLLGLLSAMISIIIVAFIVSRQKLSEIIKGRVLTRLIHGVAFILFISITVIGFIMSIQADSTAGMYLRNLNIYKAWAPEKNYYTVIDYSVGEDSGYFTYQSTKLQDNFLSFYKDISDIPGVYYANELTYTSKSAFETNNINLNLPQIPLFKELDLSPSFISALKIKNESGKQFSFSNQENKIVYLLPEIYKNSDVKYRTYFNNIGIKQASSKKEVDWYKKHPVEIFYYSLPTTFFSWNNTDINPEIEYPVIQVVTPNNINPITGGDLVEKGLSSPLKLEKKVITLPKFQSAIKKNQLSDNNIDFNSIEVGLEGSLDTIKLSLEMWGVGILLTVLTVLIVLRMVQIQWYVSNKQKIIIQKFLGYSSFRRFHYLIILVCTINLLLIVGALILHSWFATILGVIYLMVEILAIKVQMIHIDKTQTNLLLKGE